MLDNGTDSSLRCNNNKNKIKFKKREAKGRFVNMVKNDQINPEQDKRSLKREIPENKSSR